MASSCFFRTRCVGFRALIPDLDHLVLMQFINSGSIVTGGGSPPPGVIGAPGASSLDHLVFNTAFNTDVTTDLPRRIGDHFPLCARCLVAAMRVGKKMSEGEA